MRIDVLTLFPEALLATTGVGVVGRAQQRGLLQLACWNPRDHAAGNYRRVDERPFGGGPGMVMLPEALLACWQAAQAAGAQRPLVYLSPQGPRFTQAKARALAASSGFTLLCGRYEGVDERFLSAHVDEELSIGDFVLSGGEPAAAVVIDAVGRLLEGALNTAESAAQDSFEDGLLDCPHFTRSESLGTEGVPPVLLSGDHAAIARWRRQQALGRTWRRRPDLLARLSLSPLDRRLLAEYMATHGPTP